jgi:hypothetical protein
MTMTLLGAQEASYGLFKSLKGIINTWHSGINGLKIASRAK